MNFFCHICKEICVSRSDLSNHWSIVHKLSKEHIKSSWENRLQILAMDSDEGQEIVPIEEQEIQIVAMDDDEEQEIQFVAIPPGPPILNSGKKLNKCNKCDYASSQASHLRSHLKTHSGEKSSKCNQCDYATSKAANLRTHLKTHSGEKSNKQQSNQMLINIDDEEDIDIELINLDDDDEDEGNNLKDLEDEKDGENKIVGPSSSMCKDILSQLNFLEKRFHCKECGKDFKTEHNLKRHIGSEHHGLRFPCSRCDDTFTQKVHLKRHFSTHENGTKWVCYDYEYDLNEETGRRLHCKLQFGRSDLLERHKDAAHKLKKYQCEVCSKKFSYKHSLKPHSLIHAGTKPYKCWQCEKSFTQTAHLNLHFKKLHE